MKYYASAAFTSSTAPEQPTIKEMYALDQWRMQFSHFSYTRSCGFSPFRSLLCTTVAKWKSYKNGVATATAKRSFRPHSIAPRRRNYISFKMESACNFDLCSGHFALRYCAASCIFRNLLANELFILMSSFEWCWDAGQDRRRRKEISFANASSVTLGDNLRVWHLCVRVRKCVIISIKNDGIWLEEWMLLPLQRTMSQYTIKRNFRNKVLSHNVLLLCLSLALLKFDERICGSHNKCNAKQ